MRLRVAVALVAVVGVVTVIATVALNQRSGGGTTLDQPSASTSVPTSDASSMSVAVTTPMVSGGWTYTPIGASYDDCCEPVIEIDAQLYEVDPSASNNVGAVWTTGDAGAIWQQLGTPPADTLGLTRLDDTIAAWGYTPGLGVWLAPDIWGEQAVTDLPGLPDEVHPWGDRIVAIIASAITDGLPDHDGAWSTADGVTWSRVAEGDYHAATIIGEDLWLLGRVEPAVTVVAPDLSTSRRNTPVLVSGVAASSRPGVVIAEGEGRVFELRDDAAEELIEGPDGVIDLYSTQGHVVAVDLSGRIWTSRDGRSWSEPLVVGPVVRVIETSTIIEVVLDQGRWTYDPTKAPDDPVLAAPVAVGVDFPTSPWCAPESQTDAHSFTSDGGTVCVWSEGSPPNVTTFVGGADWSQPVLISDERSWPSVGASVTGGRFQLPSDQIGVLARVPEETGAVAVLAGGQIVTIPTAPSPFGFEVAAYVAPLGIEVDVASLTTD